MPIYEYACAACGHEFEEWQKMADKPVRTCPRCKARKVERLISHTSFQLKGGGWYKDLYAGPRPQSAAKDGAEGGSAAAAPAVEKAPDKPAAKESRTSASKKPRKKEAAA